jgi:cell division protein FtsB
MRLLVVASALFAGAVLLTGLPVSALLAQHSQLSDASAALSQLQGADRALADQSRHLSQPGTVSGVARAEYGMVASGQKAYVILPPSGASPATVAGSGHVPLDGPPVAPGSAQSEALLGGGATADPPVTMRPSSRRSASSASAHGSGSFWSRVVHTLEFWR